MNFEDMQEAVWRAYGRQHSSTNTRKDYELQECKDSLNAALDEIFNAHSYYWSYVRTGAIAFDDGTAVYALDDFCRKVIDWYTVDEGGYSGQVKFMLPSQLEDAGLRTVNSSSFHPTITWYAPRLAALSSGTNGAINEGSKVFTSAGASFTSSLVGKKIIINGRDNRLKVATVDSNTQVTLDREWRGQLRGIGTTNVPANITGASYEIGPVGTKQIEVLPTSASIGTIYYRYVAEHPKLLSPTDRPDFLPEQFHSILVDGGISRMARFAVEDQGRFASYFASYQRGLEYIRTQDETVFPSNDTQLSYASWRNSMGAWPSRPGYDRGRF
jgi:hypothetical protein